MGASHVNTSEGDQHLRPAKVSWTYVACELLSNIKTLPSNLQFILYLGMLLVVGLLGWRIPATTQATVLGTMETVSGTIERISGRTTSSLPAKTKAKQFVKAK